MSETADTGQHSDATPINHLKTYKFTVDDRHFRERPTDPDRRPNQGAGFGGPELRVVPGGASGQA